MAGGVVAGARLGSWGLRWRPGVQTAPLSALPVTPSGAFYRRPLAEDLIPFSSEQGRQLFLEAMESRSMESYWPLAENFQCQAHPAFCGLTTLTMVLNSLGIDPGRPWKGPWRWFTEEMLDCCKPMPEIVRSGLSLREFATLARCQDAHVEVHYAQYQTIDDFRDAIREVSYAASQALPERRLVVSFDRKKIGQTGSGHYSPVAGYHEGEDRILVLDTARFKYPPFWVRVDMMWDAMTARVNPEWPLSRGWMCIRKQRLPPSHCPSTISSFARVTPQLRLCWSRILKHFLVSSAGIRVEDAQGPQLRLAEAGDGNGCCEGAETPVCCTDALQEQLSALFLTAGGNGNTSLALALSDECNRQGLQVSRIADHIKPLLQTETRRCVSAVLSKGGFPEIVDLATLLILAATSYPPFKSDIGGQAAHELEAMHARDMATDSSPLLNEHLEFQVKKIRDQMHILGQVPKQCLML